MGGRQTLAWLAWLLGILLPQPRAQDSQRLLRAVLVEYMSPVRDDGEGRTRNPGCEGAERCRPRFIVLPVDKERARSVELRELRLPIVIPERPGRDELARPPHRLVDLLIDLECRVRGLVSAHSIGLRLAPQIMRIEDVGRLLARARDLLRRIAFFKRRLHISRQGGTKRIGISDPASGRDQRAS